MKQSAAILFAVAINANAAIFQCGSGLYTDKPCEGGKALEAKQSANPAATNARIDFDLKHSSYPVHGSDYFSAFENMKARGKFNAWASWKVTYTFNQTQTPRNCVMSNLVISIAGEILMPNWVEKGMATPDHQAWWNTGQRQLQIHEDGHIQHGREFAILLRERLLSLNDQTCQGLELKAKQSLMALESNHRSREEEYDRLTYHGLRQFNHD